MFVITFCMDVVDSKLTTSQHRKRMLKTCNEISFHLKMNITSCRDLPRIKASKIGMRSSNPKKGVDLRSRFVNGRRGVKRYA